MATFGKVTIGTVGINAGWGNAFILCKQVAPESGNISTISAYLMYGLAGQLGKAIIFSHDAVNDRPLAKLAEGSEITIVQNQFNEFPINFDMLVGQTIWIGVYFNGAMWGEGDASTTTRTWRGTQNVYPTTPETWNPIAAEVQDVEASIYATYSAAVPTRATNLTFTCAPTHGVVPWDATIGGRLTNSVGMGIAGAEIRFENSNDGGITWIYSGIYTTTLADGSYAQVFSWLQENGWYAGMNTLLRALFAGSADYDPSTSPAITIQMDTAPEPIDLWDSCDSLVTPAGSWVAPVNEGITPTLRINTTDKVEGTGCIEVIAPTGMWNVYLHKGIANGAVAYDFSTKNLLRFRIMQKGPIAPIIFTIITRDPDGSGWNYHSYGDIGSDMTIGVWKTAEIDLRLDTVGLVTQTALRQVAWVEFNPQPSTVGCDVLIDFIENGISTAPIPLQGNVTPTASSIEIPNSVTLTCNPAGGSGSYTFNWYVNNTLIPTTTQTYLFVGTAKGTYSVYAVINDGTNIFQTAPVSVVVTEPLPTPVPARPLHCEGRWIKDDSGATFHFHGTTQYGYLDHPYGGAIDKAGVTHWGNNATSFAEMLPYLQEEINGMRKWGFNSVRMMFCVEWWLTNYLGYRDNILTHLEMLNANGFTVVLCPWSVMGGTNARGGAIPFPPYLTTAEVTATGWTSSQDFVNWWGNVASYLKSVPSVVFDLWNEPTGANGGTVADWMPVVQRAINAIRATGATQPIMVGWDAVVGYEFNGATATTMDWVFQYPLTDPLGNLIYTSHIYRSSTSVGWWWTGSWATRQCAYLPSDIDFTWVSIKYPEIIAQFPFVIGEIGVYDTGQIPPATHDGSDPVAAELSANRYIFQKLNSTQTGWISWWFRFGAMFDLIQTGVPNYSPTAGGLVVLEAIPATYTLTTQVSPAGVGVVTADPAPPYDLGTVVSLTAIVTDPNYQFVKWTNSVGADFTGANGEPASSANTSVTMNGSVTLIAVFQQLAHPTLTLITSPAEGGALAVAEQPPYNIGQVVNVTATPATNYTLSGWLKDGQPFNGTDSQVSLTMDASHTLTAIFTVSTQQNYLLYALPFALIGGYFLFRGNHKSKRKK